MKQNFIIVYLQVCFLINTYTKQIFTFVLSQVCTLYLHVHEAEFNLNLYIYRFVLYTYMKQNMILGKQQGIRIRPATTPRSRTYQGTSTAPVVAR